MALKKYIPGVLLGAIFLLPGVFRYWGDYFYSGWFFGGCALFLHLAYRYRCDKLLTANLLYFSLNAFYISSFVRNRFIHADLATKSFISLNASQVLIAGLLLLFWAKTSKLSVSTLLESFGILCFVNSVLVIVGWIFGFGLLSEGIGYSGFINYASLNGCLIIATLPLLYRAFDRPSFWKLPHSVELLILAVITVAPVVAMVLSKSSIPWGCFFLMVIGLVFCKSKNPAPLIATAVVTTGVALYFEGPSLFNSAYRFEAYELFMKEWWKFPWQVNLFGTGPGSYIVIGPEIQIKTKFLITDTHAHFFTFLHNDFLQYLFENGIIGSALLLLLIGRTLLFYYRNDHALFSVTLSYLGMMLFNYPLRYFITAFLGFLLLWGSSGENTKNSRLYKAG